MSVRDEALRVALSQVGVRETSRNSGPEVDSYLASVELGPGYSWCAAFVHWSFVTGAASIQQPNPCPHTAGALRLWDLCPATWQTQEPEPGDVFVIDHMHGLGHVGFVVRAYIDVDAGNVPMLETCEGNTNGGGSREGDGVYRRTRRRAEINRGFLRIGAA